MTDADKLVEDCARAMHEAATVWIAKEGAWDEALPEQKQFAHYVARAVLALAVERCAKVAENFSSEGDMAEHLARVGIAAQLRSLSPNAKGDTPHD